MDARRYATGALLAVPLALCVVSSPVRAGAQAAVSTARTVLAAVVTTQGRPVVDVDADDFVVTEGTEPRDVLDVHIADYPLALVIDDRLEASAALPVAKSAARRFVERVGERPVALLLLASSGQAVVSLEGDRAELLDRLSTLEPATTPAASPFETVARAAAILAESGAPFSAVVVVAGASVDANTLVRGELLPRILGSGAAVHVVELRQSAAVGADSGGDGDLLRVLADQTRGQFTGIFTPASYDVALDRLADRLAIEMMIQYLVPPGPKAGDVRVGVRKPGARVVGLGVR